MKKIILMILTIIFISGCATSSLNVNKKDELVIKYEMNELILSSKVKKTGTLNYKDISIVQNRLQDEYGRVLFYEDVQTDLNYEFNFNELYSLLYIFGDIKEYERVYTRNNLSFFQLLLANDERMNVIVQASSSQRISFVYGFSNYEFIKLAKKIKADSKERLKRLRYQATTLTKEQKPLTKWSTKLIYFTPLITPFRELGKLH